MTQPCGTPHDIPCFDDRAQCTLTDVCLSEMKSLIKFNRFPWIPRSASFFNNMLCDTESKAWVISRNTANVECPFIKPFLTSNSSLHMLSVVQRPLLKPFCCSVNILLY